MLNHRKAEERGRANLGWLDSRHTFSFGHYRDANQQGFSDLLVINKADLAPYVNVNLEVMKADAARMRAERPFVFTDLMREQGVEAVIDFIAENGGLTERQDGTARAHG